MPGSSLYSAAWHSLPSPLALIDWHHQTLVDCNRAFCEELGHSRSELVGRTWESVFGFPLTLYPTNNHPKQVELFYHHGDGRVISYGLQSSSFQEGGGSYGIIQLSNLTDQNRADASQQAAQDRTRVQDNALMDIASDESIHRGDLKEAFRNLTSRAAQVLGIDRVSVWQLGTKPLSLNCRCLYDVQESDFVEGQSLQAADYPRFFDLLQTFRQLRLERPHNDPRLHELTVGYLNPLRIRSILYIPIRLGGNFTGILCCEHRKVIHSWRPSEQAFVSALGELAALAFSIHQHRNLENQLRQMMKMESVGRLAGGMAHDFNNIIQAIDGYTRILLESPGMDERALDYLAEVKKASEMAIRLTRKLLAMSRKQPMELRSVSLNQIIQDVSSMLSSVISKESGISLTLESNLPATLVDPSMIEQVIINLVLNARDALPPWGGHIDLSTRSQTIVADDLLQMPEVRPGRYVVINVTDNGIGMDDATQSRLFEPFFTTKSEGKGTGLGLSIVYGIIKQHEGWIEVRSKPNFGTTFEIFLPTAG